MSSLSSMLSSLPPLDRGGLEPSIPHLSDFLFSTAVTSSAKRQFSSKLDSLISNNVQLLAALQEQGGRMIDR
jgi:hypothetical protein